GQAVGADLRLTGADPRLDPQVRELIGNLSQVDGFMPATRAVTRLPDGSRVPLLSVVSDRLPEVVRLRDDLVPAGGMRTFAALGDGLPRPDGIELPEGTRRLVGTVRFDGPRELIQTSYREASRDDSLLPMVVPGPQSGPATLYLADGDGVIRPVLLGPLSAGQVLRFDVPVPAGSTTVVGVGAGINMPAGFAPGEAEPQVAELSWHWRGLAAVDGAGNRTPLSPPDSWRVWARPGRTSSHPPELRRADETEILVGTSLNWFFIQDPRLPFLVTDPVEVPPVPALFTPAALAGVGGRPGEDLTLPGPVTVRVAGTVPAVPGVAELDGVVTDLGWLSLQRYLNLQTLPTVNEWWLATSDPAPAVTVAQGLGLQVHDRRAEEERLLADPLGGGVLLTLWTTAALAALLAAFGSAVDSRATAVGRRTELAVLHTLGTSPAAVTSALVVEQAVLAGLGVAAGIAVGLGVAAAMAASLVLTLAGTVPLPEPLVTVATDQLAAYAVGLFVVAVLLGAFVARRARRELAAGALKIGDE
ncbi:MAG: ABC transporter permease, partial [Micromonosporaceae bacterium]